MSMHCWSPLLFRFGLRPRGVAINYDSSCTEARRTQDSRREGETRRERGRERCLLESQVPSLWGECASSETGLRVRDRSLKSQWPSPSFSSMGHQGSGTLLSWVWAGAGQQSRHEDQRLSSPPHSLETVIQSVEVRNTFLTRVQWKYRRHTFHADIYICCTT